jgi:hypothetical protein
MPGPKGLALSCEIARYIGIIISSSVADPDHFGKRIRICIRIKVKNGSEFGSVSFLEADPDLHPHQSGKLDQDPDPHQSVKQDPDPDQHQSEKVEAFEVILEPWTVQIWKKVSGRIRNRIYIKLKVRFQIRIRVNGRIRIRI